MGSKHWTQSEIDILVRLYPDHSNAYISEYLHRSPGACGLKARELGVNKSPEFAKRQREVGQFRKGHRPFNAGRKQETFMSVEGRRNSARTRFQCGESRTTSPTYREPGYECVRKDKSGRLYIYIKPDDGRRMMPKHRYVWEQAHGEIPKGYNVQFKDGNTLNCTLDNLYLISRSKQVRKNFNDLPDERKAEVRRKMQESRNKSIKADRLRLRWGLEPIGGIVKRFPK